MTAYPSEPLTPEERELAQLTGRLGPHAEPSPALDAKILAAAHAAVVPSQPRKSKPRWPVAMGLAASVVFAVGVAWQLRPVEQMATVSEAPVADQEAAVAAAEAPVSAASQPPAADAVAQVPSTPTPAKPVAAPPSPPAAAPIARAEEKVQAAVQTRNVEKIARPAAFPSPQPPTDSIQYRRTQAPRTPDNYSPPPPLPIPAQSIAAPAPEPAPPQATLAESNSSAGFANETEVNISTVRAGAATAATQREMKARAAKASATDKARESAKESAKESNTLDRVEVTGSRVRRTDLQVPVVDDTQLAVNDWLERVRTRYGLGDADAARQSLLLFVRDHPRETVPDDLEPLLEK